MKIALGFATIDRLFAAERLIQSARLFFPNIQIYVADQSSSEGVFTTFCDTHGVHRIRMPYDCGVAASRNALVEAIEEEYFVLCDDDFILTPETNFEGALKILDENPKVGVVGGFLSDITEDGRQPRHWEMFLNLDRTRRTLTLTPIDKFAPIVGNAGSHRFFHCDTALNFALMRRSIFDDKIRWDPMFKCNGEHEDFYLNLRQNSDVSVAYYPGMRADHQHVSSPGYMKKRARQNGWLDFLNKWEIDQHLDLTHGLQTRKTIVEEENAYSYFGSDESSIRQNSNDTASQVVLTAQGKLIASSPAKQKSKNFVNVSIELDSSFHVNIPNSETPITSAENLFVFAAFDPVLASQVRTTIWLRVENIDDRVSPLRDVTLDLRLRWRSDGRYLNWSGDCAAFRQSAQTQAEWHPHQIMLPFSLNSSASVDLEIWDKVSNKILTTCNFTSGRKLGTKLYPQTGLCIGHTPDERAKSGRDIPNHLAITDLPILNDFKANKNPHIDISKHVGLSWSFDQNAKENFTLPKHFPYNAASLIVPRQQP